jgi:hypothetical protein
LETSAVRKRQSEMPATIRRTRSTTSTTAT